MSSTADKWPFSGLSDLHSLFGWEEYSVLASVLLVSVSIGAYFAWRGQRSTAEYLSASRQMSLFPTTLSLACSFISAITILGTPSEMYVFGTQYWVIGLSYPLVLAATAHIYMPVFYRLQARGFFLIMKLFFLLTIKAVLPTLSQKQMTNFLAKYARFMSPSLWYKILVNVEQNSKNFLSFGIQWYE